MEPELVERIAVALERNASASEKLIDLATEERDSGASMLGPPACPHCGRLDPVIRNEGGEGNFSDFVLIAVCLSCGHNFIATAQGWLTYRNKQDYDEGRTQT